MSADLTLTELMRLDGIVSQLIAEEPGSMVQEAISTFCGTSIPVDGVVDVLAHAVAERIGLRQSGGVMKSAAYVLTKTAILESAQLLGLAMDLSGFQIHQIKLMIEDIKRKIDVVLATPMELALDCYERAVVNIEHGDISGAIDEMKQVKRNAMTAFQYAKGQGVNKESLKNAVLSKQLITTAEVVISSYDGIKITPFFLLNSNQKKKTWKFNTTRCPSSS